MFLANWIKLFYSSESNLSTNLTWPLLFEFCYKADYASKLEAVFTWSFHWWCTASPLNSINNNVHPEIIKEKPMLSVLQGTRDENLNLG